MCQSVLIYRLVYGVWQKCYICVSVMKGVFMYKSRYGGSWISEMAIAISFCAFSVCQAAVYAYKEVMNWLTRPFSPMASSEHWRTSAIKLQQGVMVKKSVQDLKYITIKAISHAMSFTGRTHFHTPA